MSWDCVSDTVCPIARALSVVGDRWTLLILRELIMGVRRFDELQAQTGMSSHLLSTRLKRMEQDGIVERRLYSKKPPRYEYLQTAKGKDLDPVILMLRSWGMKHGGLGRRRSRLSASFIERPGSWWTQIGGCRPRASVSLSTTSTPKSERPSGPSESERGRSSARPRAFLIELFTKRRASPACGRVETGRMSLPSFKPNLATPSCCEAI